MAYLCQYCDERVWNEDIHYDEGQTVCPNCFDRYFLTCEDCGRTIHQNEARYPDDDEDLPCCEHCYSNHQQEQSIHDYSYKPPPRFFGEGPRYFGVELEVENDNK